MMKIKITNCGGYVVGDGPCPVDPDAFMNIFMDRIMDAKRAGLGELDITDEEFDAVKQQYKDVFSAAPVVEIEEPQEPIVAYRRIMAALDAVNMEPLRIPERFDVQL
jgi:hypothetical protein